MRTVPVVLINRNRRLKVNALLDDASTKTYINADVAAELGLHGCVQKTNVNILNGQVETFLTMPVEFNLESLDGKVNTTISAFTTEKVEQHKIFEVKQTSQLPGLHHLDEHASESHKANS